MNAHTLESRLRTIEDRLAQMWQHRRVVGEVDVHLHDEVVPRVERVGETVAVGGAEPFLAGAVRLRIAGDPAESVIFFEFRHVMRTDAHLRQGVTAGYYRTAYVRTGAGWRIRERIEQAIGEALSHFYPGDLAPPSACRHG